MKRNDQLAARILKYLSESDKGLLSTSYVAQQIAGDDDAANMAAMHHLRILSDRGLVTMADNGFVRLTWEGHTYAEGTSTFDESGK
jgi:repressor of nif and glnA expression